jgi:archaellum component FlaC
MKNPILFEDVLNEFINELEKLHYLFIHDKLTTTQYESEVERIKKQYFITRD